jgi:hypothetical protein
LYSIIGFFLKKKQWNWGLAIENLTLILIYVTEHYGRQSLADGIFKQTYPCWGANGKPEIEVWGHKPSVSC